jgi:hypothetical protein
VLLVVADTSPINYLLLIGHIEILPALFKNVILPSVVRDELTKPNAPLPVYKTGSPILRSGWTCARWLALSPTHL